ncbi:6826_t:CDS:10, partial [Racocetra fulgida]
AWEVDTCRGHFNNVSAALFHPRQELIISDAEDKTIRVWDIERPAYAVHQHNLYYIKDKYLRVFDFTNNSDVSVLSVRKIGGQYMQPRALSYNPAERAVIITTVDGGSFDLFHLPKEIGGEPREVSGDGKRGPGTSAIFIARNRFAVLDKSRQQIEIRDLSNATTKSVKPSATVNEIFNAGSSNLLLLSTPTSVILYDIQQRQIVSEVNTPPVKYVVWSSDHSQVALLSKHTITIANKTLDESCLIHETIRIKSGAWDDAGIFVYSTLNHIKYALSQGDNGIIRTLDQPVYLTKVKGKNVYCLDRDGKTRVISIDPTEYRFKLALIKRNYDEVLQIIRSSNLVGQSIIAYLQKKGYPEIALHFVRDDKTRFDLAIECGNIDVALETAKAMDREDCWNTLGVEALRQGNHQIVEMAYQRVKNFDRLSFIYLVTGNLEKLRKMLKIAELRSDHIHGLTEEAESILTSSGLTADDITDLPTNGQLLKPPTPILKHTDSNWPLLTVSRSFFDSAFITTDTNPLAAPLSFTDANEGLDDVGGDWGGDDDLGFNGVTEKVVDDLRIEGEALEEGSGWDIDADLNVQLNNEISQELSNGTHGEFVPPTSGTNESELWIHNSPLAANHVAAGSFETAMQLLNRQVGAVNFEPLKSHFLKTFQATRTYLSCNVSLPPLVNYVRRNPEETETRRVLPILAYNFQNIVSSQLQEAYKTTTLEYIVGLSMEQMRRKYPLDNPENTKKALELAAYFTHCRLQPAHLQLSLRSAMTLNYKAKNCLTASMFARRLLELAPPQQVATQARQIQTLSDKTPRDEVTLDYDQYNPFVVCGISYTPIYKGSSSIECPYCHASYLPEHQGKLCT